MDRSVTDGLLLGSLYVLVGVLCALLGIKFLGALTVFASVLSIALGIYQLYSKSTEFREAIVRIFVCTVLIILTLIFIEHLDIMFGVLLITLGMLALLGLGDLAAMIHSRARLDTLTAVVFTVVGVCMIIWADTQFLATIIGGTVLTIVGLVHIDRTFQDRS